MKCIVIESNPDQINARPVADESGAPVIYASMTEARAELKANGYIYNRANRRYYIADAPEYRAYIVRADEDLFSSIMEQAQQNAAPEYIEPERIQTVSGNDIYRSIDPVTGNVVFTVSGRDFWELAEARYFAQQNPVTVPAMEADELNKPETIEPEPEPEHDEPTEPEPAKINAARVEEYETQASAAAGAAKSAAHDAYLLRQAAEEAEDYRAANRDAYAAQLYADEATDAAMKAIHAAAQAGTRAARESAAIAITFVKRAQQHADEAQRIADEARENRYQNMKYLYFK